MERSTKLDFGSMGGHETESKCKILGHSDVPDASAISCVVESSLAGTRSSAALPVEEGRLEEKIDRQVPGECVTRAAESFEAPATDRQTVVDSRELQSSEMLISRFYDRLYAYCFRLSGRHVDAEDLCQQVFVSLLRYRHKIHTPDAIEGWLITTARRSYWQQLKQRSQQSIVQLDQIDALIGVGSTLIDELERKDWVHRALEKLSPLARVILVMFYFEEKSYQQISEELEIPIGTVMSRLSRGKLALRDALLETSDNQPGDLNGDMITEDLRESIRL